MNLSISKNRVAASLLGVLTVSTVLSAAFVVSPSMGFASHSECSDGVDNDSDGRIDYPQDADCANIDDNSEGNGAQAGAVYLSVTDGRDTIGQGGSVVYRIEVQSSTSDRTLDVDLQLPSQATYSSADNSGQNLSGGHIRWNDISVQRGSIRVLTATVNINPSSLDGDLMIARVTADGVTATDTTRIEGAARPVNGSFSVSITDNQSSAQPGTTLGYTVRVRNGRDIGQTVDVRAVLPQFVTFVNAANGGAVLDSNSVIWRAQYFAPGEERTYTFTGKIYERTVERYSLHATAYAGNASGTDETYITVGLPDAVLRSGITDNRTTVERGQVLTYVISIDNVSHELGVEQYANASLPVYAEFLDASDGGDYDGQNVRWDHLQIAPSGSRTISFTVRVRSDAPIGTALHASVRTEGGFDTDSTQVVKNSNERPVGRNPYGDTIDPGTDTRTMNDVLFRKVASSNEIVPGGSIRYTLYVKNTMSTPIRNAMISDRFDGQYLRFSHGDVSMQDGSNLQWQLPVLQPGQEWQTSYILAVSPNAPREIELTNIATISGNDLNSLSLTERVRTVRTGVIHGMPQTGASVADLYAYATAFSGTLSAAGFQLLRRRFLGA